MKKMLKSQLFTEFLLSAESFFFINSQCEKNNKSIRHKASERVCYINSDKHCLELNAITIPYLPVFLSEIT